jgi:hypothetical protein
MTALTRLNLSYVQARGDGGQRTRTQLIVIHATDNTADAAHEASYASRRSDLTSAHVYVDESNAIQALPLDRIAYGCYGAGNIRSIQFELCGLSDHLSAPTLARAAGLVAIVARAWDIPDERPTPAQMRDGAKGIVGHGDVTETWHQGDHTDPGPDFPWGSFLGMVGTAMGWQPTGWSPWLRRAWPAYMRPGNYFGLYTGPAISHGGYVVSERADVKAIQQRLIALGFVTNPPDGWADGIFGPNTKGAVARWQSALYPSTTTRYGEVWSDDWAHLFTF